MTEQASKEADGGKRKGFGRAAGLALIAGAADDDCSAIGTYASAGAKFGPDLLWTAPVTLPMMYTVVYLSSKLGQVSGRGLFQVIADFYPRWLLWSVLVAVLIGNAIEAAANLGAMAAAINLFVPLPIPMIVALVAALMFGLQVFGSYELLKNLFRVLALALLAYVVSAILAKPELTSVLIGTLLPKVHFNREYLSILVAIIGTTLSAYLYTWQSNQEVEEEIANGRTDLEERKGATKEELRRSRQDILIGMTFSNLIMYFIMLSTASTLHKVGQNQIETAAQAAEALRPVAGDAAGIIFAAGVIGVGFLAVPVMTTGAAFDLAQAMDWKHGMSIRPQEAPGFYLATGAFTLIGVILNFFGFNPMQALVWAGIVQGFSTPPLLLLMLLMTNDRRIMGDRVNSRSTNILGGITTAVIFAASAGLVASWFL
ncbi:Nramp family divalent metal transporter [Mesorhizobium sp.]|uniref:Nramp family divalent metal transporter n=1 Tax=Mesorhizobium sp. TaxID=1871066 RepID=UPI000FE953AF|nr:Nramp family divalent metal transporter [Mesorhizobium sp.]RWB18522.1 MAG: divalent metal cation transporter [Mesorhizobium sp.]RWD99549.1 MAG: divalent metal cation transporter [Mesorhizobium sp.]